MEQLELFPDTESPPHLEGVQILLARMEQFPEEFTQRKWQWVNEYLGADSTLTAEEKTLLKDALHKTKRTNFTSKVLATLNKEERPSKVESSPFDVTNSVGYQVGYQNYQKLGSNQLTREAILEAQKELENIINRFKYE